MNVPTIICIAILVVVVLIVIGERVFSHFAYDATDKPEPDGSQLNPTDDAAIDSLFERKRIVKATGRLNRLRISYPPELVETRNALLSQMSSMDELVKATEQEARDVFTEGTITYDSHVISIVDAKQHFLDNMDSAIRLMETFDVERYRRLEYQCSQPNAADGDQEALFVMNSQVEEVSQIRVRNEALLTELDRLSTELRRVIIDESAAKSKETSREISRLASEAHHYQAT